LLANLRRDRPNPDFRYQLIDTVPWGTGQKSAAARVFNRYRGGAAKLKCHSRFCPAQHGDVGADLLTRQLTAFSVWQPRAILISLCSSGTGVTPKRPAATCLIDEEAVSPALF